MVGLIKWIKKYRNIAICKFLDKGIQFDFSSLRKDSLTDIFHFYASNLSMKREFFENFDETMRSACFEDVELAYRLSQKGLKIIYNPKAIVIHDHYYDKKLLIKKAYITGKTFKYLEKKIPNLKQNHKFSMIDSLKLDSLFFLQFINKYKIPYYHFLYVNNFLKGYKS